MARLRVRLRALGLFGVVAAMVTWIAVEAAFRAESARSEHARRGIAAAEAQLLDVLAEPADRWTLPGPPQPRHPFAEPGDYRTALAVARDERARKIVSKAEKSPAVVEVDGERWLVHDGRVRAWAPIVAAIERDTGVHLDTSPDGIPFLRGGLWFGTRSVTARVPDPSGHLLPWLDLPRALAVMFAVALLVRERLRVHAARERDEAREAVLYRISHELRTPAASIRSLADALAAGAVAEPEGQRQFLAMLSSETERLALGIERLLRASRGGDGELPLAPVRLDLAEWTRGVAERWRARIPALRVDVPDVLPWRVDPERLGEAVDALLDNAAKHGGPSVVLAVATGGRSVRISVHDDGRGVPEVDRQRVFGRLQRVEGRPGDPGGYGLGLWAASEVARAHRGTLTLEGGSRFVLTLPEGE